MDVREKLEKLPAEYFNIGDSYAYNLTRVKSAFAYGTVGLDDFEEFDAETVEDIASYLIDNGVTVQECGNWKYYHKQNKAVCTSCSFERDLDANFGKAIACPNCGAYMPQPPEGE